MFPLLELVVSDGFSEIKVKVGTSFLLVKICLNYLYNYWLKYVFQFQVRVNYHERDLMRECYCCQ